MYVQQRDAVTTPGWRARISLLSPQSGIHGEPYRAYTQTARTGRSNQVASLWAAMPKSTKNHTKSSKRAKLKSLKTNDFGYQNQLLKPESDPAWLETPWVLFLAPTQVAQPLGRWYRSLFTRSGCMLKRCSANMIISALIKPADTPHKSASGLACKALLA